MGAVSVAAGEVLEGDLVRDDSPTWNDGALVDPRVCGHSYDDDSADPDCNLCGEERALRYITLDGSEAVNIAESYTTEDFLFAPAHSGYNEFYSDGSNTDAYGYIYDVYGNQLTSTGDIDGNGRITMRDLALLVRHINGWDVEIAFLSTADVNGDGKINIRDAGLLQQYLNGFDVSLA